MTARQWIMGSTWAGSGMGIDVAVSGWRTFDVEQTWLAMMWDSVSPSLDGPVFSLNMTSVSFTRLTLY